LTGWHGVRQTGAIDKEEIEQAVFVVIKHGNATTHAFRKVFTGSVTRLVLESDLGGNAATVTSSNRGREACGTAVTSRRNVEPGKHSHLIIPMFNFEILSK
jgi:hypothetical protein